MLTKCHIEAAELHHDDEEVYYQMLVARLNAIEEDKENS
jgi:hypothetical protein